MTIAALDRPESLVPPAPRHVAASANVARRLHTAPPKQLAEQPERPSLAKMQDVEDQLLAAAIEQYAQDGQALDRALDDMAILSAELNRSRRRPLLLRSAASLSRVEDLLLEAIVRAHPNRERALDRLLDAVVPEDALALEHRRHAEFDAEVDNDFDGLA